MAKILVVDDDLQTQALLMNLLTSEGHLVRTAASGLAALHILTTWRPDLLLVDVLMPVMHGITLCQYLNGDPNLSTIPLVLMSGRSNHPMLAGCVHQGFLEKPFAIPTVLALVHALVDTAAG